MNACVDNRLQCNQNDKINESILQTNGDNNRTNECIIIGSPPFEKVDRFISYVSKSICKIKIERK